MCIILKLPKARQCFVIIKFVKSKIHARQTVMKLKFILCMLNVYDISVTFIINFMNSQ